MRFVMTARRAHMTNLSRDFNPASATPFQLPYVMMAVALIGMAVAFYDSYAIYSGQPLWCPPPINGCNEVASSPYARIFNLPVGYFGVVYYLYMFCLAVLLAFDPNSRALRTGAIIYAALGVCFSIY